MKAIILSAGRGSRMGSLTTDSPKCLIEVQGKTLLQWQFEALTKNGISEIAIVTGYKRESLSHYHFHEFHNSDWNHTNMVTSLACASEWLQKETCIVTYSDIFYKFGAIRDLMSCTGEIVVSYSPDWLDLWKKRFGDPLIDAETFRFQDDGVLTEIGNVPRTIEEIQGQYMGLLKISPRGWNEIDKQYRALGNSERNKIDMTGLLQKIIGANNLPIHVSSYLGIWGEVDTTNDLNIYSTPEKNP